MYLPTYVFPSPPPPPPLQKVERGIPGSSYVLSGLLGPLAEVAPLKEDEGLLKKKLDREKKKKPKEVEPAPLPAAEEVKPGETDRRTDRLRERERMAGGHFV